MYPGAAPRKADAPITPLRRALIIAISVLSFPFLVAIALAMIVLWLPGLIVLHVLVWLIWIPKRCRGVMVYSNSPNWQLDVEQTILPVVHDRMIVLNWSERKHWPNSVAVWLFRFINFGRRTNFNPMAIIFRPLRPVKTVRFFDAYRDAKHGNPAALDSKKKQLFELIR